MILRGDVAVAILLCAARASASCDSTVDCLRLVETALGNVQTLTARVTQTKHLSVLDEPLVSTGRLAFKRPDRLLWIVDAPHAMRIVIDRGKLNVAGLSSQDSQALAGTPAAEMTRRFCGIFSGDLHALQEAFDARAEERGADVVVVLEPRDQQAAAGMTGMELHFASPLLAPTLITFHNALGDTLKISLHDIQRDVELPDSLFAVADDAP